MTEQLRNHEERALDRLSHSALAWREADPKRAFLYAVGGLVYALLEIAAELRGLREDEKERALWRDM